MILRAVDLAALACLSESAEQLRRPHKTHLLALCTSVAVLLASLAPTPVRRPVIACCVLVEVASLLWLTLGTIPGAQPLVAAKLRSKAGEACVTAYDALKREGRLLWGRLLARARAAS